eukprot:11109935-Lingulodinium_polyedra.AAC.1
MMFRPRARFILIGCTSVAWSRRAYAEKYQEYGFCTAGVVNMVVSGKDPGVQGHGVQCALFVHEIVDG